MRAWEGAEQPRVLVGAIVNLDDVVERSLEEGKLPKDHCRERQPISQARTCCGLHSQALSRGLRGQAPTWGLRGQALTWGLHKQAPTWGLHNQALIWKLHNQAPTWGVHSQASTQGLHSQALTQGLHRQAVNCGLHSQAKLWLTLPGPELRHFMRFYFRKLARITRAWLTAPEGGSPLFIHKVSVTEAATSLPRVCLPVRFNCDS